MLASVLPKPKSGVGSCSQGGQRTLGIKLGYKYILISRTCLLLPGAINNTLYKIESVLSLYLKRTFYGERGLEGSMGSQRVRHG